MYSIPSGTNYFIEDGSQNHFLFQPLYRCFRALATAILLQGGHPNDCQLIISKPSMTSNYFFNPELAQANDKM